MIDALYPDTPDAVTQEDMDASLTLHEAKRWGYWPGETPGTAEEYMVRIRVTQEIDARYKAATAEANDRSADAAELEQLSRAHVREIDEQDDLWFHGRVRERLSPVTESMRGRVAARVTALF